MYIVRGKIAKAFSEEAVDRGRAQSTASSTIVHGYSPTAEAERLRLVILIANSTRDVFSGLSL